ncbi:DNA primase family protein [Microbacterium sp. NPDC055903]
MPKPIFSQTPSDDNKVAKRSSPLIDAIIANKKHFAGKLDVAPLNEVLRRTTLAYLSAIDPANPPSPAQIERVLLSACQGVLRAENVKIPKGEPKYLMPRTLYPVQVALVVHHLHHVAEVTPGGANSDDGLGVLAIYQQAGEYEGLYRRTDMGLLGELAKAFNFSHGEKWFAEFERQVRLNAAKVTEMQDPDLVVMRDCILDYRSGERFEFSPDRVFLARNCDVRLIEKQHPVPRIAEENGNVWDLEQFWEETIPDEGTRAYLMRMIGAALRPRHDWQKMPSLHAESGSNGKGTILAHVRALVGERNCASVPIKDYGSQFGKEQLIGIHLNAPDETPVGEFIKDASDLKAIITNDPIRIDRKHKPVITYKPSIFTILTLNGALNFRDKTESMDRRLAIVPMTQRFPDGVKNKAIKDDYLRRTEVLEYMAYKVLVEIPKYWELEEPASVRDALRAHKRETNTVLAFFDEYHSEFQRPVLPFPMLRALYAAWLKDNRPDSKPVSANSFTKEIKALFDQDVWVTPQVATSDGSDDQKLTTRSWLTSSEPVLDEYHYIDEVSKWQWVNSDYGPPRGLPKSAPRQVRGLMRRDVYEAWVAAGMRQGSLAADAAVRDADQCRGVTTNTNTTEDD